MTDEEVEEVEQLDSVGEIEPVQEIDDLGRLHEYTRQRGYRRWTALTIFLVGCIPALLLVATQGRNVSIPLIAGLLIIVPTGLLLLWTLRDPKAQSARELGMWVRVVQRAGEFGSGGRIRRDLPDVPISTEIDRINLADTAAEYRETLTPLIANPGVLSLRVTVYRYWYVVGALVITLLAAFTLIVFSPSFS